MADTESRYGTRNSLITFLISLVAGAIGIYAGALVVLGTSDFTTAVIAALIGAIVWGVASFFLGWIPLLGSVLTFLAWLGAINWMYTGGWITAAQIALFAWVISLVVVYLADLAGLTDEADAMGVPGA